MAGNFNLNDYVQVNERVELFYKKYPNGSIQTEIVSNHEGEVIVKAFIYRDREDTRPCTGHAMEVAGSSFINKTSHIENCETSAVGRALAMLGFEIKKSIASQEEVANAKLQQEAMANKPSKVQMLALVELAKHKGIDLQRKSEEITGKTASKDWTMQDYFNIKSEIDDIKDKVS
jgi:hypothetical protein